MLNSVIEYLKYSYKFYPDKNVMLEQVTGNFSFVYVKLLGGLIKI